jgi:TolB-like protein/class 3 adenylate cyclase/Flp pilus assembly protein TadD
MKQPVKRRLAAILAADVAGYSRLMGADEEGTHERLKAHLGQLINPKIKEHRGRVVKNTGDGMLAEFSSVVDAVRCAADVQRGMIDRNAEIPEDKRIGFRIGINLGDIIVDGNDIYGDGVNVAARLEALAELGGICISRVVRDQIRDKLPYKAEDMGEQVVKNIARPVRAYAIKAAAIAELLPIVPPARPTSKRRRVSPRRSAPRLSIVVLPFDNMGGDPDQQYFADGITEDLTTDLSRIADMFVISRNTAFTYRNKPVETKQIGRELNVRYVLEGSVRRLGNRARVNAQLIDAETDAHVWAERFDRATEDLFALQDEVTNRIANALNLELLRAEAARPVENLDAFDYILRARAAHNKSATRENFAYAISLIERALTLDPSFPDAKALLGELLAGRVLDQMTDTVAADIERAEQLVRETLAVTPRSPIAHFANAQILRCQNQFEAAIPEFEIAIAFNRNWVAALAALGHCKFLAGSIDEAIPAQEQAIRLSPRDPRIVNWYWRIGIVHLLRSRTNEAILWIEKARSENPGAAGPHAWLASAYALEGETERAATELAEARRLSGDSRYSSIARFKETTSFGVPENNALAQISFFAGLRKAGVPEE